jgi:hypothetical protein
LAVFTPSFFLLNSAGDIFWLPIIFAAQLAALLGGGFISGLTQPKTQFPALVSLVTSPGLYFFLPIACHLINEFSAIIFLTSFLIPTAISWAGCRLGIAMRLRKQAKAS